MESKKINQLATSVSPQTSDLTIIGDPITGVSKKITLLQIANLFATTGTVSSVAVTETGDALTITGSPITSAGTINIGFAGEATQYVRGDGALADFPTSTGGGSSVSYYLNSSVSQGTIGGVAYRQLSKDPISGAGTDITISADGYVASYITDANDPALLEVPGGNFNCEFYFSVNSNNHDPSFYAELYKYDGSTFTLLGSSQSVPEYLSNGTTISPYYFAIPVATAALSVTDRLAIRIYVNVDTRVVTLHTENNHLCQVVTTFSKGLTSLNNLTRQVQFLATGTSGTDFAITSSTATHTFNLPVASATNTGKLSSTDWSTFNAKQPAGNYVTLDTNQTISGVKTFTTSNLFTGANLFANFSQRFDQGVGILETANFGSSLGYTNIVGAVNGLALRLSDNGKKIFLFTSGTTNNTFTFPDATGTIALTSQLTGGTVTSVGLSSATSGVTIGSSPITTSGTITLAIATASGSQNGLLSSTDWSTFNGKYNLPSLTSGSVLFSNSTTIAQNNANFFWDNTNSFLGVGTNVPSAGVTSFSATAATQFKAAGTAPAITFSNTLTSASLACVFGLATSNNQFITGTAAGDMAIANQSTSAGAIVFGTGTTEKMRMTSAGTFSIGNTNSTFNLDVTGTGRFTGVLTLGSTISNGTYTYTLPSATGTLALTSDLSAYLPLTGGTLTGALSGTSATFSSTLGVTGAATFSSTIASAGDITITKSSAASFIANNTSASGKSFRLVSKDDGNFTIQQTGILDLVTITSGGNVGIGTSSPAARLTVATPSGSSEAIRIICADTIGDGFISYYRTSGERKAFIGYGGSNDDEFYISQQENAPTLFFTNNTERMRITSGGDILYNGSTTSGNAALFQNDASFLKFYAGNSGSSTKGITFNVSNGGGTPEAMRITSAGNTQPGTDNAYSLGVSGTRWSAVWAANGTIQTSDEREKKDIVESDLGLDFVSKLRPVSFKWKIGKNEVTTQIVKDEEGNPILDDEGNEKTESVITPIEGKRTHYGLIAQEVEALLDGKDFGGFIHDEETDIKGLRYDQFVPLLIKSIQELQAKIVTLESKIK